MKYELLFRTHKTGGDIPNIHVFVVTSVGRKSPLCKVVQIEKDKFYLRELNTNVLKFKNKRNYFNSQNEAKQAIVDLFNLWEKSTIVKQKIFDIYNY